MGFSWESITTDKGLEELWRKKHKEVMEEVLDKLFVINNKTNKIVLKGGTALLLYYGLNRFSEDLDFNSDIKYKKDIDRIISGLPYEITKTKDTDTTLRYMIHYGNEYYTKGDKPLKLEISFRDGRYGRDPRINRIDDHLVYTIDTLASMKISALMGRNKVRDIFDVCFIVLEHYEALTDSTVDMIVNTLSNMDIVELEWTIDEQYDELIDKEELKNNLINTYDKLNVIID